MQKCKQMPQAGLLLIPRFVLQDMSVNSSEEKLAIVTFGDLRTGRERGAWPQRGSRLGVRADHLRQVRRS